MHSVCSANRYTKVSKCVTPATIATLNAQPRATCIYAQRWVRHYVTSAEQEHATKQHTVSCVRLHIPLYSDPSSASELLSALQWCRHLGC